MQDVIDFNLLKEYDSTLKNVLGVWQKEKAYSVNEVIQYKGKYLKCTTAGTSGTTTLDFTGLDVGDTINDGTVVWEIIEPPSGSGGVEYSTEERKVGTWIDGKPLYQKTYSGTLAGTTLSTIDSSLGVVIDWIVYGSTTVKLISGSSNLIIPNGFYDITQFISKPFKTNDDKIVIKTSDDYNSLPYIATIQYTKTTD